MTLHSIIIDIFDHWLEIDPKMIDLKHRNDFFIILTEKTTQFMILSSIFTPLLHNQLKNDQKVPKNGQKASIKDPKLNYH